MNVRIISYKRAKHYDKTALIGSAFGYPRSSPIWGNHAKVLRTRLLDYIPSPNSNSNSNSNPDLIVELILPDGNIYCLPLCCIKQKYAKEALLSGKYPYAY